MQLARENSLNTKLLIHSRNWRDLKNVRKIIGYRDAKQFIHGAAFHGYGDQKDTWFSNPSNLNGLTNVFFEEGTT